MTREVRSLVLDQYIERVVATLDPDLAQVRAELVQQRKGQSARKLEKSRDLYSGSFILFSFSKFSFGRYWVLAVACAGGF